MRIGWLFAFVLVGGCAFRSTPSEFDLEVRRVAPIGTPIEKAVAQLTAEGFTCRALSTNACSPVALELGAWRRVQQELRPPADGTDMELALRPQCDWGAHSVCSYSPRFYIGFPLLNRVWLWSDGNGTIVKVATAGMSALQPQKPTFAVPDNINR